MPSDQDIENVKFLAHLEKTIWKNAKPICKKYGGKLGVPILTDPFYNSIFNCKLL